MRFFDLCISQNLFKLPFKMLNLVILALPLDISRERPRSWSRTYRTAYSKKPISSISKTVVSSIKFRALLYFQSSGCTTKPDSTGIFSDNVAFPLLPPASTLVVFQIYSILDSKRKTTTPLGRLWLSCHFCLLLLDHHARA